MKIIYDETSVSVVNDQGVSVPYWKALEDCKVGDVVLTIKELLDIRMSVDQMMAAEGLIELDPKTWC